MKKIFKIIIFLGVGSSAYSQFTVIPIGTTTDVSDIVKYNDTILISGKNNYFAKTYDLGQSIVPFIAPGQINYYNSNFQVVNNSYYLLSVEGFPYNYNQVLKSSDYGVTWEVLYDTTGLFYTLSMFDSSSGIIAGTYGNYAVTQNNDSTWLRDTLFGSWYLHSTATAVISDSTLILLTDQGTSVITNDKGITFSWGYCHSSIHEKIQVINPDTIYSVSHKGTGNEKSYFSFSINGGYNFSTVMIGYNSVTGQYDFHSRVYDLYFDSPQHGYMIGYVYEEIQATGSIPINQGTIFETNDFGQTWTPYISGFNNEFYSLLNVNDSIAFIGGSNGLLLKWNKNIPLTNVLFINEQAISENVFSAFPNPANDVLNVHLTNNFSKAQIIITDLLGVVAYQNELKSNSITIPLTQLAAGLYSIEIMCGNQRQIKKLIIQH